MKLLLLFVASFVAFCGAKEGGESDAEREARLVAAYSTRTVITLTTTTITGIVTCVTSIKPVVCQKRRIRNAKLLKRINIYQDSNTSLQSTLEEFPFEERMKRDYVPDEELIDIGISDSSDRDGRIALTVWTTTSSTYTITSTSIDSGTTLSLSYYCSVNGVNFPPACG